jgi:exopolysaccharide biosynthesis WecB/TagA/CpsF family protein
MAGLTQIDVLGVPVTGGERDDALDRIAAAADEQPPVTLAFANAHTLNLAASDPSYRDLLERFDFVLNDGAGVALAARMQGRRFVANLNGSDFTPHILERCAARGWSVFLLGGLPGVAEEAGGNLWREIAGLRIAGTHHGYFGADENEDVVAAIRASEADVLLVALGNPRQEAWVEEHLADTGARMGVAVGAFLDFAAGRVPRAPARLNRLGVEWLYRLFQEPGRLWRRYILGNPRFVARVAWARLTAGVRRTGRAAPGRSSAG